MPVRGPPSRSGMIGKKAPLNIDPLLEPLLLAASDEQTDSFLSQLIATHLEPVIKGVIRYKLHFNSRKAVEQAEADDIAQEITLQLLAELQKFRQEPQVHSISNVCGLAAVIAHRTCSGWMRSQFPERHALKNRLHYLLTRQRGFALWQDKNRKLMAGFAAWHEQSSRGRGGGRQRRMAETVLARLKSLADDEKLLGQIRSLWKGRGQSDASDTLATIFNHLGDPIEFDELVSGLAEMLAIKDRPVESTDQNENAVGLMVAGGERDTSWQVEKRMFLQRLWEEVRQLPLNQRVALLLNLRDSQGRGCIALFPAAGIATVRELAETLGMSAEELAGLWSELPLQDASIADRLRLTRQQVINTRKSARERLKRRLKGFI